jgi:hypothetical protein
MTGWVIQRVIIFPVEGDDNEDSYFSEESLTELCNSFNISFEKMRLIVLGVNGKHLYRYRTIIGHCINEKIK